MKYTPERKCLSARRAFTLVELLVVVAIIALLISILLPSLNRAKGIARMVKCSTNQHAIGRGSVMYASEYNDYVHRDAAWSMHDPDSGQYVFASRYSPYVGGPEIPLEHEYECSYLYDVFKEMPVLQCPCFQDLDYALTYVVNGWNFVDNTKDWTPPYQLSKMTTPPAEVGYIVELNPGALPATSRDRGPCYGAYDLLGKYVSGHLVNYDLAFNDNGTENLSGRMITCIDQRHFGNTTIVFYDGHAESRKLTKEELPARLFFPYERE